MKNANLVSSNWIIGSRQDTNGIEEGRLFQAINKVTDKCVGEIFIPKSFLDKCNTRDIPLVYTNVKIELAENIRDYLELHGVKL